MYPFLSVYCPFVRVFFRLSNAVYVYGLTINYECMVYEYVSMWR